MLLTNDGDLATKLLHPSANKKKIYHVHTDKKVSNGDLEKLCSGIMLEDGRAWADMASYVDNDQKQVGVEIHSGKNRSNLGGFFMKIITTTSSTRSWQVGHLPETCK